MSAFEGYVEKMEALEARKQTRLQVAEKRRELQMAALESEYKARLHDLAFSLEVPHCLVFSLYIS